MSMHGMPSPERLEFSLDQKVLALRSGDAYAHAPVDVHTIETHFAWVFLAGQFAYKLKKPVHQGLMDHRSVAARRHHCEEELWLNRRLAPEVYLAVVPLLADSRNQLRLFGNGDVVDWLVKMRRLDRELFLDRNMSGAGANVERVRQVSELLVNFYRRQPVEPTGADLYLQRFADRIEDNRHELSAPDLALSQQLIDCVVGRQQMFVERSAAILQRRAEEGRIIEAHGDLRPEHIYLGEPVCVIDCLEFDRSLRVFDPLEELAYLLMECKFAGAEWIAREVIVQYRRQCSDAAPESLLKFYASHRAATRAKIVAWHLRDPEVRERADWRGQAERYLQLAGIYLDSIEYPQASRDSAQR